jgi:hypothetical protein
MSSEYDHFRGTLKHSSLGYSIKGPITAQHNITTHPAA